MGAKTRFTVGREQDCDIAIADSSVSRLHAEISLLDGEKLFIRDCNSRNGTEIIHSGQTRRIAEDTANASDTLRFGTVTMAASELVTAIRMLSAVPQEPSDKPPDHPSKPPVKEQHLSTPPLPQPDPNANLKKPAEKHAAEAKKPDPKPAAAAKTELIRCECGAVRPRDGRCADCGAM
jgi:pSer/pThr/pTyr-binding forkhead associated (FHA) protein